MLALMQISLAVKVRPHDGWGWLLGSGLVALVASAAFLPKLAPLSFYTREIMAGVSLVIAATAYLAIGLPLPKKALLS
jgi:uncharacterized membrane protein HdeD (DUF308 family)